MDVNITYLGNSANLSDILSVQHIRNVTGDVVLLEPVPAEGDMPPEWTNFNPFPGRYEFPGKVEVNSK